MYTAFSQHPFSCNYWVTYRCNSHCQFCRIWQDQSLQSIPDATYQNAKKNLDDLKKIGVTMIDFTGGEPLLNKELPQILSYAKKKGFLVKLSTNGFLYPKLAEELQGSITRLYFSFDTTSSEEYRTIRGIDGYTQLLESITIAKKMGQEICLSCTLTDETINNIDSIAKFSKEHKIITYIHPCFSYFDNKQLSKSAVKQIKDYFWHPYIRMNLPDLDFYIKGGNDPTKPRCLLGKSTLDISPDNYILLPCFHHHTQKIPINGNLLSLFNSTQWKEFYKNNGRYPFCDHCTIDCYFGLSYWDKIKRGFFKENLTMIKLLIEYLRPKFT